MFKVAPRTCFNNQYLVITDVDHHENTFPLREISSSPLPSDSSICPTKITKTPNFLQANPMYVSDIDSNNDYIRMQPASSPSISMNNRNGSTCYIDSCYNNNNHPRSEAPSILSFHGSIEPLSMGCVHNEQNLDPSVLDDEDDQQIYATVNDHSQPLGQTEKLLEVNERNIRKLKDLGMGQFGEVELAHTTGLSLKQLQLSESNNDPGVSLVVAVKRLKSEADETMREAFEKEIKFMARLNHENVVRLLGVCLGEKAFIMMEYMEEGDLNDYLKKREFATVDSYPLPDGTVDVAVLVYICLQVASGMKYLATLNFIQRDLATRNILVGQNFKVKIADFGMSQNLYSSLYYKIKGRAVLPIRWMANECFYGQFSEKTDVWSFGVTMWEIFTLCRQRPYDSFTDQELIDDAIKGEDRTLLSRPETCPEEVYHVMLCCWVHTPEERANFEELHGLLLQIRTCI